MFIKSGILDHHVDHPSQYVEARHIDVWLPPQYQDISDDRYPVIYMHDGQNLFDPATSFIGVDWGIAQAMSGLMSEDSPGAAIVVGIWNTPDRFREYLPVKPVLESEKNRRPEPLLGMAGSGLLADNYLKFIVEELKTFIDGRYRTRTEKWSTFIMGSSMGALISLYALCEYPEVFGGAACLSTHWPALSNAINAYLERALPPPGTCRLYFDHGTETLDGEYENHQRQVDAVIKRLGYERGRDWITLKFIGSEHSERSWRQRVHIPIRFLLSGRLPAGLTAGS
jgi:predicted alpha/beta superfamily hydrolase